MTNQISDSLFLAGLVIGGLVGAGLALILAPQSGDETRGQIRARSFELKDGAMKGLARAGQRARAQSDTGQEEGQEVSDAINPSQESIVQVIDQSEDKVVEAVDSSK